MDLRPEEITKIIRAQIKNYENKLEASETGVVILVGDGIAKVSGLGVAFVSKNWKLALAPICLMLVLFVFVPALNAGTVGIMVPVSAVFTIAVGRILYTRGVL